jgi:hypothetical protein
VYLVLTFLLLLAPPNFTPFMICNGFQMLRCTMEEICSGLCLALILAQLPKFSIVGNEDSLIMVAVGALTLE